MERCAANAEAGLSVSSCPFSPPSAFHLSLFSFFFFLLRTGYIPRGVSHPKTLVYSTEHHYILPGQPCKQRKLASYTSLACISVPSLQEFVLLRWNSPIKTILRPFHRFARSRWFVSRLLPALQEKSCNFYWLLHSELNLCVQFYRQQWKSTRLKGWKDWRPTLPLCPIVKTFCLSPLNHRDIYVSYEFMELSRGYFQTSTHLKLNVPWAKKAGDAIWTCFNADLWSLPSDWAYWRLHPPFAWSLSWLCHIFPIAYDR